MSCIRSLEEDSYLTACISVAGDIKLCHRLLLISVMSSLDSSQDRKDEEDESEKEREKCLRVSQLDTNPPLLKVCHSNQLSRFLIWFLGNHMTCTALCQQAKVKNNNFFTLFGYNN